MIHISEKAQIYLKNIIKKKKDFSILRIAIDLPGTKYAECKIFYDDINNVKSTDIKINYIDFNIYVNNKFIPYLKESKIDLFQNHLNEQLMLMAPYANKEIVNKSDTQQNTSLFQKVNNYILKNINPMLFNHGGKIVLINITKSGYVMIEFHGGCNGCAMSKTTVKEGIEKNILSHFPDLKGVKDITNHTRGVHSFF